MSALIRLYPQAWRDRYEAEFRGVLASRPPGMRDRIDIVGGAIDARLHAELPGDVSGRPLRRRVPVVVVSSIVSGVAFLAWTGLVLRDFPGLERRGAGVCVGHGRPQLDREHRPGDRARRDRPCRIERDAPDRGHRRLDRAGLLRVRGVRRRFAGPVRDARLGAPCAGGDRPGRPGVARGSYGRRPRSACSARCWPSALAPDGRSVGWSCWCHTA